jgi:hypothetical protein
MPDDPVRNEVIRQFRESWARKRQKGRRRFAAVYGVAYWGGLSAIGFIGAQIIKEQFSVPIAAGMSVAFGAAGYFFGLKIWDYNESQFLAEEQRANPPSQSPDPTSGSSEPP